jgi:hypothetical protein
VTSLHFVRPTVLSCLDGDVRVRPSDTCLRALRHQLLLDRMPDVGTAVTDAGVAPIIDSCRRLKTLMLDGVRGVTPECRETLQPPPGGGGFVTWTVY